MTAYTEDYIEILFATSHDSIVFIEENGYIKKANPQFYTTFGISPDAISQQSFFAISNGLFDVPEIRSLLTKLLPEFLGATNVTAKITRADGKPLSLSINASEIPQTDSSIKSYILSIKVISDNDDNYIKNLSDIIHQKSAELEESQSLLNSILNSSHYEIASYEPIRVNNTITDFRIRYKNPEVHPNIGVPVAEVTGKTCRDVYPGIFENGVFEKMVTCLKSGTSNSYEIDSNQNGKPVWLSATIEKVNDSVTVTSKNITKEKEATIFRESVNELLNNKNKELNSFTSIASHDLQEPLRKIQMFISRISESNNDFSDATQNYFNSISSTANRMQNLIDSLLSYSSMDSEDFKPVKTNLNKILKGVLAILDNSLQEKGAVIENDELPSIRVVSLQFKQVFANILGNALKYSKPDVPPIIKITASKEIIDGQTFCKISFEDNGIGFDPQYKDKIFEVFQRLHGKKEYVGSGVGLAICKKIVEKHNGFMTAEGFPGKGSVFSIYLPTKD